MANGKTIKYNKLEARSYKPFASAGFTLLETLIAVAIIMIAVSSAFGLVPEGLSGTRFARNQTTASYLAAEAMEIVTNIRDNRMIYNPDFDNPDNWLIGMEVCIGPGRLCVVNAVLNTLIACGSSCPPVRFINDSTEGGVYGNGGRFALDPNSLDTIFTRTVNVTRVTNSVALDETGSSGRDDMEILVEVQVSWKEGSLTKRTILQKSLFDWMTFNK